MTKTTMRTTRSHCCQNPWFLALRVSRTQILGLFTTMLNLDPWTLRVVAAAIMRSLDADTCFKYAQPYLRNTQVLPQSCLLAISRLSLSILQVCCGFLFL